MVTVLMSTYNGEKYLSEQLDSILNQKNVELNILVRDDGSSDQTLNILEQYENRYNNISHYIGENLGCGKSFYELLKNAPQSDYYAFSDQDDVWLSDKLFVAIERLEKYDKDTPALYSCRTKPVDNSLKLLEDKRVYKPLTFGRVLVENHCSGCTFVFNRTAAIQFLRFPREKVGIHDWDLLRIIFALNGNIVEDSTPYILYRQHDSNTIGSTYGWKRRYRMLLEGRSWKGLSVRFERANQIRSIYYEEMNQTNKNIIDCMCNYKRSLYDRIKLFLSKDIVRTKISDNIIFKLMVLFGLI